MLRKPLSPKSSTDSSKSNITNFLGDLNKKQNDMFPKTPFSTPSKTISMATEIENRTPQATTIYAVPSMPSTVSFPMQMVLTPATTKHIRPKIPSSQNIKQLPVGTVQVVPFAKNVKKMIVKKCHWCRKSKCPRLIMCLTCKKHFFYLECVKERYFEKKEVKVKCPACRGTCSCQLCMKILEDKVLLSLLGMQ